MQIFFVRLDLLVTLGNVRQESNDAGIHKLAQSMQDDGQETEIRIYSISGGKYAIKHGHRRVQAAKLLGWTDIRAVLDEPPADEVERLISQYNENEQRQQLGFLDQAYVYQRLKDLGWQQQQIAKKFGITEPDVSLALATLRADPKLQKAVEAGQVAPTAIESLLSQPLDVQATLADAAIHAKTGRKIANLVRMHKSKQQAYSEQRDVTPSTPNNTDPLEELAAQELQEALDHMRLAEQTRIQHPELQRKVRPTVEELVRKAAVLKQYLDGKTYDDTADLV